MAGGSPRAYDLSAARPDGWFEQVLEQSEDFEKAAELIGRSTLGLALIAGARIVSLTASPHSESPTTVEFSIGEDPTVRQVPLSEFRETIGQSLLTPLQSWSLPDDADAEALQAHIGGRYMLEAALFQVEPLELRADLGLSEITLQFNELRHVLGLDDFRDVLDERVRSELGIGRQNDNAIDLAIVDQAEDANAHGNWGATVAMLNPWLTSISMLLRTGEAEGLSEDVHGRLSVSLDLLGTAYANMGELDAANEVLRLGIQWAGESGKAGGLFLALGRASAASEKHGEAIGLLRRAIRLGAEERDALPLLARSLGARDQVLAAMVCSERARELGADVAESEAVVADLQARLGEAWPRFQAWMSAPE
ncbi:MAG: tetratricopeptide repeat protein [Deltaproteobacteria bacterium]|nr:tetratricopeptide repeat protein [Deltaproteobacteria bacterium]MBW1873789.1 tetratricopeptide repeat protein [Deltaproteobacteria bacterium]MBW2210490.1 tetratricopeptide repeat protein [Deltaproteobacteria bacterium]MBW2212837.1 tetratricopeptide repeat protein [Deltaproteobacteria bacterium]MBW2377931.1 tetratricopeptide repeat protein [Deltaproteobacteria bacterium]